MILLITIIGIPLAAAVFALYPPLLLLGYLTTILFVGDRGANLARREGEAGLGRRVLALALTLVAFAFIAALPWVGPLVTLLALLIGVGALALTPYRHFSNADRTGETPAQHPPPSALSGAAV
jgi:hypothetical protein